ncbi:MAG: NADH-quinone oxidoreductase subunit H [Candidatus Omnitrophica bacterium]|nr:NADH-quinone oxidoreductase subunit H [Candidatus Omnitrophota bacterium]
MFSIILHWLIVLGCSPLFVGIINRVKAVISGRRGPSIFQPYFDLFRLMQKQQIYSRTTTWVFRATPAIVLASMLCVALIVPFGKIAAPIRFSGDIILVAYILALARFFMIISALDTGYSMEGMGASREAFFSCLAELVLFMNFITLAILVKKVSLSQMIGSDVPLLWSTVGAVLIMVVVSFFVVLLTENCRIPIDDPETHLELTMIHEVMILDNSGVDLAYILYASAIKLFIFAAILVPIIIPFKTGILWSDMCVFFAGMTGLALLIGLVESGMARLKLNRVRNFLLIAFALAFFGFIVTLWRI